MLRTRGGVSCVSEGAWWSGTEASGAELRLDSLLFVSPVAVLPVSASLSPRVTTHTDAAWRSGGASQDTFDAMPHELESRAAEWEGSNMPNHVRSVARLNERGQEQRGRQRYLAGGSGSCCSLSQARHASFTGASCSAEMAGEAGAAAADEEEEEDAAPSAG